jgi:cytochrome c
MNKLIILTLLAGVALPVQASQALATKSNCMTCHQVDKKVLGPSFKAIAEKYKGQKDAEALLTDSQIKGSKGKWGAIPMPAQRIAPADAQALSKWMLSL